MRYRLLGAMPEHASEVGPDAKATCKAVLELLTVIAMLAEIDLRLRGGALHERKVRPRSLELCMSETETWMAHASEQPVSRTKHYGQLGPLIIDSNPCGADVGKADPRMRLNQCLEEEAGLKF